MPAIRTALPEDVLQALTCESARGALDCWLRPESDVAVTACSLRLRTRIERNDQRSFFFFFDGGTDRSRVRLDVDVRLRGGLPSCPPLLGRGPGPEWWLVVLRRADDGTFPAPRCDPQLVNGWAGKGPDPAAYQRLAFALPPEATDETPVFTSTHGEVLTLGGLRADERDPGDGSGPYVRILRGRFDEPAVMAVTRNYGLHDEDAGCITRIVGVRSAFLSADGAVETFWRREPRQSIRSWASAPLPVGVLNEVELYIPGRDVRSTRDPLVVVSFGRADERHEVQAIKVKRRGEPERNATSGGAYRALRSEAVRQTVQTFLTWRRDPASFPPIAAPPPDQVLGLPSHERAHGHLFDTLCRAGEATAQALLDGWALRDLTATFASDHPDANVSASAQLRIVPGPDGRLVCTATSEAPEFLAFLPDGRTLAFSADGWKTTHRATPDASFRDADAEELFFSALKRWAEV